MTTEQKNKAAAFKKELAALLKKYNACIGSIDADRSSWLDQSETQICFITQDKPTMQLTEILRTGNTIYADNIESL